MAISDRVEVASPARPPARVPARIPARRRWGRRLVRAFLLLLGPVVVALVGAYYWVTGGRYVTTDNAYVRADRLVVTPEVSGRVVEVPITTNQFVAAGTVLLRIDARPYEIALEQAEAQLTMVRTEIAVLKAEYRELVEETRLAETDAVFYEQEYRRLRRLAERQVASTVTVDEARHKMDLAIQEIAVREGALGRVLARLAGDPSAPDENFARFINARTRRDQAALDLGYTVIVAPTDGFVGTVGSLRPGAYVTTGKPVLSLIESADLWLEANIKETDLAHVRSGQAATVTVDAYPDLEWSARVTTFSPATGTEFSVLPAQNATGNWVKIVQRVPVRLRIERRPEDPPLRVGMSATVTIDTGHERPLPDFVTEALAWLDMPR